MYKVIIINKIIKIIFVILILICLSIAIFTHFPITTVFVTKHYDEVVIIDAGHGGIDGGASTGDILEKDINLAIAQKTHLLMNFCGIKTLMTREEDISLKYNDNLSVRENKAIDLNERLSIASNQSNAIFLSIHLNKFEQSQYSGAQVFYSENNDKSREIAENIQASLIENLDKENTRKAKIASNSLYLMNELQCPAVIVECGFLSNEQETKLLNTEEYQTKIAISLIKYN